MSSPAHRTLRVRHVTRYSYGRHYRDATPTTGTLYGSSPETMTVEVTVDEANQAQPVA